MTRSLALILPLFALALAPLATGCGTSDAAAAPTGTPATAQAQLGAPDVQQTCVSMMRRSRTCTSVYIPALVDERARLDHPAGIAAEVAKDRAGVIAQANAEWATDSTDASIAQMCSSLAAGATAEQQADAVTIEGCLTKASCEDFTTCSIPVISKHFARD